MLNDQLLRVPEVSQITSLSRVSIWRYEKQGKFPQRRKIGPNRVGWLESEVRSWMSTRPVVEGEFRCGREQNGNK